MFIFCQIVALHSAVVKQETNVKLAWRLPYLSNVHVSPQEKKTIYKHTVRTQTKRALNSHTVRVEVSKNPAEPQWTQLKINIMR